MRNQTAVLVPELKQSQSAMLLPESDKRTDTVPEPGKRTQTTILISEPNKMYCDLLKKAFYVVRSRFQRSGLRLDHG